MSFNGWFYSLPEQRQAILIDDKWMLAQAAFDAGFEQGQKVSQVLKSAEEHRAQPALGEHHV